MATTTMVRVAVPAYSTRDHKHRLEQAQTKRQEAGVQSTIGNGWESRVQKVSWSWSLLLSR